MASTQDFNGKWALVTGASAGIGVALARDLAGHGAKLILTARRKERLDSLAAELSAKGTEVKIVVADLNDPAAPQQIYDATEGAGLTVDILINNAGLGQFGQFYLSPIEQELSQVRVNCEAVVRLTRLFMPRMVERRRGWVLIVASTASYQPLPYLNTYAATKVFDRFFAQGLGKNCQDEAPERIGNLGVAESPCGVFSVGTIRITDNVLNKRGDAGDRSNVLHFLEPALDSLPEVEVRFAICGVVVGIGQDQVRIATISPGRHRLDLID